MLGINQFETLLSALQAPALAVHSKFCSRVRHGLSECTLCSDNCPTKAIEWTDGILNVDPDGCTSCGICANVCPNGVFEALKPNDFEILDKVRLSLHEQKEVVFECNPDGVDKQNGAIVVPSLARLDEGVLVGCFALGAQAVWLSQGPCQGCKYEPSQHVAEETVKNANSLLELFGLPRRILFKGRQAEPLEERATSRREFFTNLVQETKKVSASLACGLIDNFKEEPPKRVGSLPTCLPMKRKLLLGSMGKLGNLTEEEFESPLFCRFEANGDCTGCQMCAFFCPTGALSKLNEDGKVGVSFKASDCTACGLCQEICYRKAVRLSHSVNLRKVINRDIDQVVMRKDSGVLPWEQGTREREVFVRSLLQNTSAIDSEKLRKGGEGLLE